jgi:hypothetical protein
MDGLLPDTGKNPSKAPAGTFRSEFDEEGANAAPPGAVSPGG